MLKQTRLFGSLIFILVTSIWWLLVVGGHNRAIFCCDARFYLTTAREGLFHSAYDGYRSYFNFLFVRVIAGVGEAFGLTGLSMHDTIATSPAYSTVALVVFVCSGIILIAAFGKNLQFWLVFVPIYMNPIILAGVPYPLQVGQFILLGLPMITACLFLENLLAKSAVAGLLAGLLWMIKPSLLLPALAVLAYATLTIYGRRHEAKIWLPAALTAAGFIAVVAPQSIHRLLHSSDLMPYDRSISRTFLHKQVTWGWRTWKYATAINGDKFSGLWTPTGESSADFDDTMRQAKERPATAVGIALGHVFAAFAFSPPVTYVREKPSAKISAWALFSGFILFLGISGTISRWTLREASAEDVLIDGITLGTVIVLPILAVESRFALPAFSMLSVRAGQLLCQKTGRSEYTKIMIGAFTFSALFAVLVMMIDQISTFPK